MSGKKPATGNRHRVVAKLLEAWPASDWAEVHMVLAVSGGADSVALLRAMVETKRVAGGAGTVIVGHLNHRLRPGDAEDDAIWLAELCQRLDVPCELGTVEKPLVGPSQAGLEESARQARYDFLRQMAEKSGARYVVTAHTADDQVETVLHHLIRGTGLAGLAGIPATRPLTPGISLVRPLLGVWRSEIEDYLGSLGQTYRTDSSNADLALTRNRIRNRLLDHLRQQFNPDVDRAVLRLAQQAGEAQAMIDEQADQLYATHVRNADSMRVVVDIAGLVNEPAIVVRELCKQAWTRAGWPLQAMGLGEWERLVSLVTGTDDATAINLPSGVRASMRRAELVLERAFRQ